MTRTGTILCLLGLLASPLRADERIAVDVELALAVDISRSMDLDELRLQREGYAAALEHPAVTSAFALGRLGQVAVTYYEWGGPGRINVLADWTLLRGHDDARALAARLRAAPLTSMSGTSISGAMEFGAAMIEGNAYRGTRRVIDISGDGPNNLGRPVSLVRDEVAALGIEINGLPLMLKEPFGAYNLRDLDFYYEDCVITGESAFVIPVERVDRLISSIRQKLVLEVAGFQPEVSARLRQAAQTDCMIGEKLRRQRNWP